MGERVIGYKYARRSPGTSRASYSGVSILRGKHPNVCDEPGTR
jgi:hypothetical protein